MYTTPQNPVAKCLTSPVLPNYLEKLNSTQPTIRRLPAPKIIEDPTLTRIEDYINWVRENPKTAMVVGIGTVALAYYFLRSDSKHN